MAVYRLSAAAERKLAEIYAYSLLNFGEVQADDYFYGLHAVFDLLAQHPLMGRTFRQYRRHEHGSHTVFYAQTDYGVLIVQIFHYNEDIDSRLD